MCLGITGWFYELLRAVPSLSCVSTRVKECWCWAWDWMSCDQSWLSSELFLVYTLVELVFDDATSFVGGLW